MTEKNPQNNTIEWWRNITSLVVSIAAAIVLANYWIRDDKTMLYTGANLAFAHCVIDLFFTSSPEIWFHHFIVISFRIFQVVYNVDLIKTHSLMAELIRSELSTFFLAFRHIFKYINQSPSKTKITQFLESVNEYAFVVSFIWIRIVLYFKNALLEPELYRLSNFNISISQPFAIVWIYGTTFTFFILNLYWFSLILKTFTKKLIGKWATIEHAITSESFLEYTFYLNIFIAGLNYHYQILRNDYKHFYSGLFDMIGIVNLAMCSHKYHYEVGRYLKEYKSESQDPSELEHPNFTNFLTIMPLNKPSLIQSYINDSIAIQFRCLCAIVTWTNFAQKDQVFMLVLSTIIHFVGYLDLDKCFLFHYIHSKSFIDMDSVDVLFPHLFPILFDNIVMIVHPETEIWQKVGLFTIVVLFGCMKLLRPFYHYSHIGTHVLLWFQTGILSYKL